MICPYCNEPDTKVIDSRTVERRIKRRRECTKCGRRFTTFENYDVSDARTLLVQKKNGTVEMFNPAKIIAGISGAVKKRPITAEQIDHIAEIIEEQLSNVRGTTLTTSQIGDIVLDELSKLDEVAYIRFASVYKDFDSADSFIKLILENRSENTNA